MAFSAIHADAGRVDATLPDLGCGLTWDQVHKVRPRVALRCPECDHGVHARVSSLGMRHFAHDPGRPPHCAWLNESLEHHQLKLALANAARSAGWLAELEVTGPDANWRADVLATSPDQTRLIAWEAQLSPITDDDIRYRTARYEADGIEVCWVTPNSATWLGSVPAIRIAEQAEVMVIDGAAGFQFKKGRWQTPACLALTEFVRGVQDGSVVVHEVFPRYRQIKIGSTHYSWRHRLWTTAASIEAEAGTNSCANVKTHGKNVSKRPRQRSRRLSGSSARMTDAGRKPSTRRSRPGDCKSRRNVMKNGGGGFTRGSSRTGCVKKRWSNNAEPQPKRLSAIGSVWTESKGMPPHSGLRSSPRPALMSFTTRSPNTCGVTRWARPRASTRTVRGKNTPTGQRSN
ncbi:competence protein CoiA family protein [Kribbella sp. NPDC006257]|uniref:competence protein CoiA n=1 Tax=Kribbella sp. NPDC006257 TaxID=3156738 RepID=UPI0033B26857